MTTQCRIRKRAVTIHPERRSKQQHLRHNNIFIYSMGSIFSLFCLSFLFTCLLLVVLVVLECSSSRTGCISIFSFDVICMYPIRNSCNSRSSSSISQKIGCRYTSYIFFCAIFFWLLANTFVDVLFQVAFFIDST